jgi:hypothetical protein
MDWLPLRAGHLITRLCARVLQSTKEDNDMSDVSKSSSSDTECESAVTCKSRVKAKRLSREEPLIYNKQLVLTSSYPVRGDTSKGVRQ